MPRNTGKCISRSAMIRAFTAARLRITKTGFRVGLKRTFNSL